MAIGLPPGPNAAILAVEILAGPERIESGQDDVIAAATIISAIATAARSGLP
jgi:hypothetical protein